jgi:hypothetical protein
MLSVAVRDGSRQVSQVHGHRPDRPQGFLAGCHVDPVGPETAKAAGILCGRAFVPDLHHELALFQVSRDGGMLGRAVLSHVGEGLADHEIGSSLNATT